MKRWLSRRMDLSGFEDVRAVRLFALKIGLAAVVLSALVVAAALAALNAFRLESPTATTAVVLVLLVCGSVFCILSFLVGHGIHALAVSRAEFERLSRTDALSGLANRRAFTQALADVRLEASLAIFDVDRFKSINDRYGHACGDAVIAQVSMIFADAFETDGFIARLGGEEFGAIVQGGTLEERVERLEDVLSAVARAEFEAEGMTMAITISAGVAELDPERSRDATYAAADKALYLAKALGRNRMIHESDALHHVWFAMDQADMTETSSRFASRAGS